VGVVDTLGPQVEGPRAGQRVVVLNSQGGNCADYAVVPANNLIPVPDDLPDEQVASILINRPQRFSCFDMCWPFLQASGCSNQLPGANLDA
jgi:D-arabinose 1-dehydrogenase-like Zn-dependent alcohol dehydrogenase